MSVVNLAEAIKGYNPSGPLAVDGAALSRLEDFMKKLIIVSLLVLAAPFAAGVNNNQSVSQSASMVAYAGRTMVGGYACGCGEPDCITEPGECGGQSNHAATVASGRDTSTNAGSIDSASSVMLLAFTLLVLFRLGSK